MEADWVAPGRARIEGRQFSRTKWLQSVDRQIVTDCLLCPAVVLQVTEGRKMPRD